MGDNFFIKRKKGGIMMVYSIIKLVTYIGSVMVSFYALSCIDFARFLKKNKAREFNTLFILMCFALAYLVASFILEFMTIRIG